MLSENCLYDYKGIVNTHPHCVQYHSDQTSNARSPNVVRLMPRPVRCDVSPRRWLERSKSSSILQSAKGGYVLELALNSSTFPVSSITLGESKVRCKPRIPSSV